MILLLTFKNYRFGFTNMTSKLALLVRTPGYILYIGFAKWQVLSCKFCDFFLCVVSSMENTLLCSICWGGSLDLGSLQPRFKYG
jgi:hypothetical protein